MGSVAPDWPRFMKRATVCAYLDLSSAEVEREISAGRLPTPVKLGNSEHWSRSQLDSFLERLTGEGEYDWRKDAPLYSRA